MGALLHGTTLGSSSAHRLVDRWRQFWFARVSATPYAGLRMAFGAIGLIHLFLLRDIRTFWSPDGIVPPAAHPAVSAWLIGRGLGYAAGLTVFIAEVACLAAMTIGYRSRAAVVLVFLGARFQGWWNALPLYGGYSLWRDLVFCLIWADTGRVWSLDAWLRRPNATRDEGQPIWPLRLMRFQIALMYFVSACWKLIDASWRDGSALLHILRDASYTRFPGAWFTVLEPVLPLSTYGVVLWELTFPFMLWHPVTRRLALASGIVIHLLMWATLDIQLFSVIVLAGYVAFIEPSAPAASTKVADQEPFAKLSA
jgi:hypothetical protein